MSDVRVLASATIDLGTNAPQTINMGAFARYVVTGFIFRDRSSSGAVAVGVSGGGAALLGSTASGLGWCEQKASVGPLQTGDLTATHAGALFPGETVELDVVGVNV